MTGYYILIANDSENNQGKAIAAAEMIQLRVANKQWEIYQRTKFKDALKKDDICLFYSAGRKVGSKNILGEGTVKTIHLKPICNIDYVNHEEPLKYIEFSKTIIYSQPIDIKKKLDLLGFIPPNRQKWGVVFMNGCRKISKEDYITITTD